MTDKYESPLSQRYASQYMLHLFSADVRTQTWRRIWVALAEAEHDLGLPVTTEQIEELKEHINDIAGVRVICSYVSDIYMLADAFSRQDDVHVLLVKDYIRQPKENGYRSYHQIAQIPIFLHDQKKFMKVEVQFRTISMDWWASLEHNISYKKSPENHPEMFRELRECADIGASLDERMARLQLLRASLDGKGTAAH